MTARHSVKLIPWDDMDFVRAYQRAAAALDEMGMSLDQADAPVELQRRLRTDGYPDATCYCERSVELALARQSRCVVNRDGGQAQPIRH